MVRCQVVLATFVLFCGLTACGQKGPLYLPDAPERPNNQQEATAQPSAEEPEQTELNDE